MRMSESRSSGTQGLALLLVVLALGLVAMGADRAAAATCADFPNQAAAQVAANTRDADGDGIYCESLRCPCLRPSTPPTSPPASGPVPGAPSAPTQPLGVVDQVAVIPHGIGGALSPTAASVAANRGMSTLSS
jgi:hypothetical protein